MATFLDPTSALSASIAMLDEIHKLNFSLKADEIILKIGIHHGPSIVVTLNDRIDYFGQTVNIAARVQGLAEADEIYMTEDIFAYPGVNHILKVELH